MSNAVIRAGLDKVFLRVNTRDSRLYRTLSIRRPRRLFQTWPGGPGVYLTPAVY